MHRALLIWNVVLTVIVIGGLAGVFWLQNQYQQTTEERIATLSKDVIEMHTMLEDQAATINEHASIINKYITETSESYCAALDENEEVIMEMNDLLQQYQEMVDSNAEYFEKILENLKELSIVLSQ